MMRSRALLDTDVLIWHLRGRESTRRWIEALKAGGVPCCSALSVTEIVLGMRPKEEAATRAFLDALDVIPVDRRVAWRAGELIRAYAGRGVTLDFVDAAIAATCLTYGLILATYNVRHYPMPELEKALPPPD
jgi:predicted nucleic acid-binding protein